MNSNLIDRTALLRKWDEKFFSMGGDRLGPNGDEIMWYVNSLLDEIKNAPAVSIKSCRECPFVADEEKQVTNGDAWNSYCEGQEVGFKKAEYVFERMKLIQETVDCIRNTFNLNTESDKLVRNCMALVQNAIDGEYHDCVVDTEDKFCKHCGAELRGNKE